MSERDAEWALDFVRAYGRKLMQQGEDEAETLERRAYATNAAYVIVGCVLAMAKEMYPPSTSAPTDPK